MFWRDPQFWNDLQQIAPLVTIILASLAGSYSSFAKKDVTFRFIPYIVGVISSLVTGYIVYCVLSTTSLAEGILIAATLIGSYFSNSLLPIFYKLTVSVLERVFSTTNSSKGGTHE